MSLTGSLAAQQAPYISASGTRRGANMANKINAVRILCDAREMTCDMSQANVMALAGPPYLSLWTIRCTVSRTSMPKA
jgi:hypothetical protein